ncbi:MULTISPECIES: pilus assembly protein [unclassified Rhizobium]|uniref:pilus assembly protein n=1 Tax=unclassified Rhizobium TaxID=2613769 RepID=UPI001C83B5F9|nr:MULTISPECIES: pilus assembly protein [unclassified Rhizobium]MBX5219711.1 pilus assembly protein [Rhizobium sp. NLR8a]MBX5225201.1 pilus assembly protein [Rhizobium sp. NLR9b]MBX5237787.1 pilus assembly protein [Rhizobium sp. NLR22b]MBX5285873.1 pilus assembly protein [Rhizobium sp. NLR10b]
MTAHMNIAASTKILVLSDDAAAASFMLDTFGSLSRYDVRHLSLKALGEKGRLDPTQFGLIVLDVDNGELLQQPELFAFRTRYRDVPLVVVSEDLPDDMLRLLFRLNGNDWLKKPLERRALIDMISTHAPGTGASDSRVHAVVSAVGGAGASMIASSLAHVLAQPTKNSTPRIDLFDTDFCSGALGYYLNLVNDYDLKPVIANPSRVDLEFIDLVRKRHPGGFSLLSFKQPSVLLAPKGGELVLRMLDVAAFESDHTIVDIPYYDTPWKYEVLTSVNSIYIVTEMTVPALSHAKDLFSNLVRLRGSADQIFIVINKYRAKFFGLGLRRQQTEKIFKDIPTHVIADDWETLSEAVNRGVLPVQVNSRARFCGAVGKLGALVR